MNTTTSSLRFTPFALAFALALIGSMGIVACTPSEGPTVESTAEVILQSLKEQDFESVALYAHPEKGIRFTPYTYVNPDTDVVIPAEDVSGLGTSSELITWGTQEGSGFPITQTFMEYFGRYVWHHDYTQAPEVLWNTPFDRGTIIDNAAVVYPDAEIVEYHFPSFDPEYGGMDWSSLRLVLEEDDGEWFLVGIIHDEWAP